MFQQVTLEAPSAQLGITHPLGAQPLGAIRQTPEELATFNHMVDWLAKQPPSTLLYVVGHQGGGWGYGSGTYNGAPSIHIQKDTADLVNPPLTPMYGLPVKVGTDDGRGLIGSAGNALKTLLAYKAQFPERFGVKAATPATPPSKAQPAPESKWRPYLWPAVFAGSFGAVAMLLFWRRDHTQAVPTTKLGSIQDYRWFVMTPSGRIAAGYEYRPDAQDFIRDMPPKGLQLVALRTLAQQGVNPNHATNWARGADLRGPTSLGSTQTPRQCAINGLSWGGNTPTGDQIARVLEQVERHAGDNPSGFAWRTGRNLAVSKFRHQQALAKKAVRDRHVSARQEREIAAGENFAAARDEFYKLLPRIQEQGSYQTLEQRKVMLDALRLTFFEGEPTAKVAAAQGVSSNVVDQRITRAKKLLRSRQISNNLRAALATRRNAARLSGLGVPTLKKAPNPANIPGWGEPSGPDALLVEVMTEYMDPNDNRELPFSEFEALFLARGGISKQEWLGWKNKFYNVPKHVARRAIRLIAEGAPIPL
jgi:DNA-directed RNA polymerase specialized sigma24 family protein